MINEAPRAKQFDASEVFGVAASWPNYSGAKGSPLSFLSLFLGTFLVTPWPRHHARRIAIDTSAISDAL